MMKMANPSLLADFWRDFRRHRFPLLALFFLILLALLALLSPWLVPHDPAMQFRDHLLQPPAWHEEGQWRFLLGTDELGRDLLSRILAGARISLLIGAVAVSAAMLPGVVLGLLAAFYPRLGALIMRAMDIMMALPALLLAIAIVAILGPGLANTMLAIALVCLPPYVRLVRASAMAELTRDYVLASRQAGAGPLRLMFRTVLPNCLSPIIVQASLGFSMAILDAAALGFLGLGVQPPLAEWGSMLVAARDYIGSAWWVVTWPGLAILLTVLALNVLGDGLRDALDPRLKG
jgi:dipeptide transport system permease protein